MRTRPRYALRRLTGDDLPIMDGLLDMSGAAFEDAETYSHRRPSPGYQRQLLGDDRFIALAALDGERVVGGIAAYELRKFEQERSEIYLYDLAVAAPHRRRGIARALIAELQRIAAAVGAYVVFVQADLVDAPAIALYSKLGVREDVLHFDLAVTRGGDPAG
jgi:aminoglycoside 3-N-acetyltransferase I